MLGLYTILLGLLILLPLLGNLFFPYIWQDVKAFLCVVCHGYVCVKSLQRKPPFTLVDIFLAKVKKHPTKPLIVFGDEAYTYHDIDRLSNQAARVFQGYLGLKEGETLTVFLKNCPAYIWAWIGLSKIGCVMGCINCNARSKILLHALSSCESKVLLTTPDFKMVIEDVLPSLKKEGIRVFYLCDESPTEGVEALLGQIKSRSAEPVPLSFRANITPQSTSLYVFTSGTTGLPKAAIINQTKLLRAAKLFPILYGVSSKDIVYTTLPLYHVAGFAMGIGGCLAVGCTCVLKSKFSVSQFWDDCRRYRVSVIQYVGEIMRYLCNAEQKPNDREHNVRLAVGNGLRADVWKEFLRRFGPIQIYEFYGASEGNIYFFNYTRKVGAVGRDFFIKKLTPYELLQYDPDTGEPVRDGKGYCIPVAPGEAGLLVCKITNRDPFVGYAGDRQKTEKKIVRDVLKKGDCYFNSGDVLRIDREGFVYFQDRLGDTFRWKGENVATTEVEQILLTVKFIQEATVYGVSVPGHEGRIGMAAIQLKEGLPFDGEEMYRHVKEYLPNYATPPFIRIQKVLEVTGTYKYIKSQLVKDGFDPAVISDPLFFLDVSEKRYVPMTQQIYASILEKRRAL